MIEIDTESTLYVVTDGANAEVHIIAPIGKVHADVSTFASIEHLRIDDPDPYGPNATDAAIYKLLCESNMEHHRFDI